MLKNDDGVHQASFVSKFYQEVQNNKANNLGNSFTGKYYFALMNIHINKKYLSDKFSKL